MVTRQSRKINDASTAAGKLFSSSENSRRETGINHLSNMDASIQNQMAPTRRSTRFSNSSNSVKVRLFIIFVTLFITVFAFGKSAIFNLQIILFWYAFNSIFVECLEEKARRK